MIQEIEPRHFYNQYYREAFIDDRDYIICFHENKILTLADSKHLDFIRYEELKAWESRERPAEGCLHFSYLFSEDEQKYFLMQADRAVEVPGFAYQKMFDIRKCVPKYQVMAAATAWHLYVWYRDNRFCGRCKTKTVEDERERMLRCPNCANTIFPKVAPAVIVGVIDSQSDRILMTKYANREYQRYALIAGFNEIGETIEQTVEREVMEEVGLHIKNIRYYKSQPWGFDQNLLLGFFCEVSGKRDIRMDKEELSLAEWVRREEIPDYGENLSLTHEMMQLFKNGKL